MLWNADANCRIESNDAKSASMRSTRSLPLLCLMSASAASPFSRRRAVMTTSAPICARATAVSLPMPWFAPVTRQVLPAILAGGFIRVSPECAGAGTCPRLNSAMVDHRRDVRQQRGDAPARRRGRVRRSRIRRRVSGVQRRRAHVAGPSSDARANSASCSTADRDASSAAVSSGWRLRWRDATPSAMTARRHAAKPR